jgi:hypothetical protein
MTKIIQFQAVKPGKERWVLDENGQIWLQEGAKWRPVIIGLPVSGRPVMAPPLDEAVVSGGHEQNQPPSPGCRVPRR